MTEQTMTAPDGAVSAHGHAAQIAAELIRRLIEDHHLIPGSWNIELTASTDPDIRVPATLQMTSPADGPIGYHRVTYDGARGWGYCGVPGASGDACFIPLPDAPTDEVLDAAAEWVLYTHRQRDQGKRDAPSPAGYEDGLPVRHVSEPDATLAP